MDTHKNIITARAELNEGLKTENKTNMSFGTAYSEHSPLNIPRHHIAIFTPYWIDLIFSGSKTIESRFAKTRLAPFGKVKPDDVVFMKESGGPLRGVFFVKKVVFYENMDLDTISEIDTDYNEEIFGQPYFLDHWDRWVECKHATLIWIGEPIIKFAAPLTYKSQGRSGWRLLKEPLDINIELPTPYKHNPNKQN